MIPDNERNSEKEVTKKRKDAILLIQEEERQRIARDLHDTSLQTLAHLVHKLELCGMHIDAEDMLQAKLELLYVRKNLNEVIDEIRETIFNLRPMQFDDLGVVATFCRFLEKENADKKFEVTADMDETNCENDLVKLTLYRIVQECVSNAIQHSGGSKIHITGKTVGDNYVLSIEDDGIGFNEQEATEKINHYGLSVIKERTSLLGGEAVIASEEGKGTKISIVIPKEELL